MGPAFLGPLLARAVLELAAADAAAGVGLSERTWGWPRIEAMDPHLDDRLLAAHLAAHSPAAGADIAGAGEWWDLAVEVTVRQLVAGPMPEGARLAAMVLNRGDRERRGQSGHVEPSHQEDWPEHVLVAAGVFGTGDGSRAPARFCRIFANEPAAITGWLRATLRILADEGAVAAYGALTGEHRIPYLGPALLTKVLYFVVGPDVGPAAPVILDKYVALALRAAGCVPDRWPLATWSTQQYAAYLDLVHGWAGQYGAGPGQIGMALFVRGRAQ